MNDYKELIEQFRKEAQAIRENNMVGWAAGFEKAADAIETLLKEREAVVKMIQGWHNL